LQIGLKQDVVLGVLDSITRFADVSNFIGTDAFFQFSNNNGDDCLLLSFDESDKEIYEYDYYNEGLVKPIGKTFDTLLLESVERISKNYKQLPYNKDKAWSVQFSINTGSLRFLVKELEQYWQGEIKLIEDFGALKRGILEIDNKEFEVKKTSYKGGGSQSLVFNIEESVGEMQKQSFIKRLDKVLAKTRLKHTVGDYGILPKY